jgi:hypothetical protein
MGELALGVIMSILVSLALWMVLPRRVVLTRSVRAEDFRGRPMYDTWALRNASALPVRTTSVTVLGPHTYDSRRDKLIELELNNSKDGDGVQLRFDDVTLDTARTDPGLAWRGLKVPPGGSLEAKISDNRTLRIRYRRAGLSGVFERREISVHGHA